ncbi:MAG: DUF4974 domain-containing protein [Chitinophaga sp.]|uniref:FecR family protein n=1 Tax=Chitinophaga sp. TaxID=1869181 RepID=UPI001B1AE1A1|nr:FecR family protein [Chitinophaga sp.]MBO9730776.1 DUF4974 domain-containing protein [Chitinophaga sp.]
MQDRLLTLFHKYVNDSCSAEELAELFELFSLTGNEAVIKELIAQTIADVYQDPAQINTFLSAADAEKILRDILPHTNETATTNTRTLSPGWWRWAAAAAVAALVGIYGYYHLQHATHTPVPKVAQLKSPDLHSRSGSNKAILTLSNGQTIALDSAQNGLLATQGAGRVIKTQSGEVVYSGDEKQNEKILYNSISTPRGGQYFLQLSDGSKVWLNAASSIRFPVTFPAGERRVYITGEAYFEVAHQQPTPFIVEASDPAAANGGCKVEVLGTKFNINSYTNEPTVSTTLLEGKVRVHTYTTPQSQILLPDQQVNITRKGVMTLTQPADVNAIIAWKNGYTQFSAVPLSAVMRQIERWYDVHVQFEDQVTDVKFTGKLKRNENLSEFLKILDLNNIKYEINNSTITIKK